MERKRSFSISILPFSLEYIFIIYTNLCSVCIGDEKLLVRKNEVSKVWSARIFNERMVDIFLSMDIIINVAFQRMI
jgi:hypothetical protein